MKTNVQYQNDCMPIYIYIYEIMQTVRSCESTRDLVVVVVVVVTSPMVHGPCYGPRNMFCGPSTCSVNHRACSKIHRTCSRAIWQVLLPNDILCGHGTCTVGKDHILGHITCSTAVEHSSWSIMHDLRSTQHVLRSMDHRACFVSIEHVPWP